MGAQETLQATLDQYGLGSLGSWAWQKFQAGEAIDQIMTEVYDTPEFNARFPAYKTLAQKGRAMSVDSMVEYERTAVSMAQMYLGTDATNHFFNREELGNLLAGDVSVAELEQRLSLARDATLQAPPETVAQLKGLFGLTDGDLTAYWFDPGQAVPLLQRKAAAAGIAGQGVTTGYGQLSAAQSEQLVAQGVQTGQAQQGFTQLAHEKQLFGALDRGETQIGQDVQLGAAFGGSAEDQRQIDERAARRKAVFGAGGGYAAGQGATGTGFRGV